MVLTLYISHSGYGFGPYGKVLSCSLELMKKLFRAATWQNELDYAQLEFWFMRVLIVSKIMKEVKFHQLKIVWCSYDGFIHAFFLGLQEVTPGESFVGAT